MGGGHSTHREPTPTQQEHANLTQKSPATQLTTMWLCYLSVAHKGGYHTAFAYRALMLYPQWWVAVPRLSTVCSLMSCSCPFVQRINSNCLSPQDEDYILGWGHGQRQLQSPWTRSHSCYCSLKSTWRTYIWSLCGWVLTVVEISRHHLMRKIYVPQAQANLGRVIHAKMIEVVDDSVIFVISYMP